MQYLQSTTIRIYLQADPYYTFVQVVAILDIFNLSMQKAGSIL
jgi:hypothetical protein